MPTPEHLSRTSSCLGTFRDCLESLTSQGPTATGFLVSFLHPLLSLWFWAQGFLTFLTRQLNTVLELDAVLLLRRTVVVVFVNY